LSNTNPNKNRGKLRCPERVSMSSSISETLRVTLVANRVVKNKKSSIEDEEIIQCQMKKNKRTSNDLQNITHKAKD
jgi:hypothetical protein